MFAIGIIILAISSLALTMVEHRSAKNVLGGIFVLGWLLCVVSVCIFLSRVLP